MNKNIIALFFHILAFSIVFERIEASVEVDRHELNINGTSVPSLSSLVGGSVVSRSGSLEIVNLEEVGVSTKLIFTLPTIPVAVSDPYIFGEWAAKPDLSDFNEQKKLAKRKLYQAGIIHSHLKPLFVYETGFGPYDSIDQLPEAAASILALGGQIVVLIFNADLSSEGIKRLLELEATNMQMQYYGLKVHVDAQVLFSTLKKTHVKTKDLVRFATDYVVLQIPGVAFSTAKGVISRGKLTTKEEIEIPTEQAVVVLSLSVEQSDMCEQNNFHSANTTDIGVFQNNTGTANEVSWIARKEATEAEDMCEQNKVKLVANDTEVMSEDGFVVETVVNVVGEKQDMEVVVKMEGMVNHVEMVPQVAVEVFQAHPKTELAVNPIIEKQPTKKQDKVEVANNPKEVIPIEAKVEEAKEYRLKVEQGNAEERYNLGLMYETGNEVGQDYDRAIALYHLAAE